HLNGRHTIFGEVESGMDVVNAIARVDRGAMDKPTEPVVIENVEIVRAAEAPTP
ncbi:MAG: peptidylprolyl isomerase, partial [Myxococcota bacterium]